MASWKAYLQARKKSFGYAFKGIGTLIRTQPHAKLHLLATAMVITLGLLLSIHPGEWAVLMLCMGAVWTAEAINTALEFLTDLSSPTQNPLAGRAKDVAAGAVLLMAIFTALAGAFIFIPRIIALLN